MILGFLQRHTKQLVLAFSSLDLIPHLVCVEAQVLALILEVCDLLIVLLFDVHEALELVLVPLKLVLEANYADVLRQFRVLLLRLGLQELQFFFYFIHVGLKGEPEVVLVLSEHGDQLLVVANDRSTEAAA